MLQGCSKRCKALIKGRLFDYQVLKIRNPSTQSSDSFRSAISARSCCQPHVTCGVPSFGGPVDQEPCLTPEASPALFCLATSSHSSSFSGARFRRSPSQRRSLYFLMSFCSKHQTDRSHQFCEYPAQLDLLDPHCVSIANLNDKLTLFSDFCFPLNQSHPCSCNFICDNTKPRISFGFVRYMSLEMLSTTICAFDFPTKPCVH